MLEFYTQILSLNGMVHVDFIICQTFSFLYRTLDTCYFGADDLRTPMMGSGPSGVGGN